MAIPWPAIPSVICRDEAIGVNRLTGINSDAIRTKTHNDMAKTPLQQAVSSVVGSGSVTEWLID
ncbi:MAG: hypothetical protein Sw1PiTSA_37360 [Shewanella algae]|uniref:Uncharacterized protein n=1 Tax=Shewanella algae TaxID=38313 RepID=A0AAD1NLS4_9GAMM|nr:hypothetical protein TUM17379_06390 [Shewanella algae]GGZ44387.1 hypothetical protein GCM10007105_33660 [Shewanella chilikensis]GHA93700.1 hypothetical protein GCM10007107_03230 [Shewanella indica]BCV47957.1 hypothetical protein TUM17382_06500 [Shewanella algae]BCV52399.1 hypothetical protein TUM17383_06460 [Shewanella algae]